MKMRWRKSTKFRQVARARRHRNTKQNTEAQVAVRIGGDVRWTGESIKQAADETKKVLNRRGAPDGQRSR
jgi:hypothetical protein